MGSNDGSMILILFVFVPAVVIFAYWAEKHDKKNGKSFNWEQVRRDRLEGEQRDHSRKIEQINQERLDIERTDFIVSGYGRKRNVRD